jgi:hypothetical protein
VGEKRIAQHGERKLAQHGGLNGRHQLARLGAEYGETEDVITARLDEHLHETARL